MFYTPRVNWLLFVFFCLATIGVFLASIFVPAFRAVSYAPLRELLIPPPEPIVLDVLYSTEKEAWLHEVIKEFEDKNVNVDGHPIKINSQKMGSWEMYSAVLDGSQKPVIISPASMLQIVALQDASTSQSGKSLVNPADKSVCRPVLRTPLVLVAWKERADILWGTQPGESLWIDLHDVLVNPQGWAAYQNPEWGYVKFGHTDPLKSNSGFLTIVLMTYGYYQKTNSLEASDLLSNNEYQKWFLEMESSVGQFEYSTGPLMQKMVAYGPSTYDLVSVYEATAIEQAENAIGRYGELKVYYPSATVWSDHPFCVLNTEWVTVEQVKASQIFIDYLTSAPAQQVALLKYGFRPVDSSIELEQSGSPFNRYSANGFRADLTGLPEVEIPPGNVLNILREFWSRNVSR